MALASPPALEASSLVHIVAPSSPFDGERFSRGLSLIEARYRTQYDETLFARQGFLAGGDDARREQIAKALNQPDVRAIVAARGGYGATRLLSRFSLAEVRAADKWLVGFSDVTALHALWAGAGLRSIHGPMVASLADAEEDTRGLWFSLLEGHAGPALSNLVRVRGGACRGRLFGGNLAVLSALLGTPHFPDLDGCVLLLEDVGERPYRVDRMLTSLLDSGRLNKLRGVLLGQFTQCEPGPDGTSVDAVLEERLSTLGVPVVAHAPIGHVPDNRPVVLGAEVELDADQGTLCFL